MKCPNCGREMADGVLYCEYCGEDIHIVPDFEPELDQYLQQAASDIVDELGEESKDDGEKKEEPETAEASGKRRMWPFAVLLAVFVVAAAVGMGSWVYLYNSEEHQVNRAVQCVAQEQYDRAVDYYGRALELDPDNVELMFALADVYLQKNNKVEYEYLLREITRKENATEEQLDSAYGRLIAIYRDRGDYDTINELLLGSNNERMLSTYGNYIADPPQFSVIEGYYTTIQPLKLTSIGTGTIYYTLDGSDPDQNATQYSMPILLEEGDYIVKAMFVNEYGIESDIVTKEYHVDNAEVPPPEIGAASGDYNMPGYIEVLDTEEEGEIYYTTDGSTPTASSYAYTEPIPMPLGRSYYKFVRIVDGVKSDVSEGIYNLVLNTAYAPEQAVQDVLQYSLSIGKIRDQAGHFDDTEAIYVYEFLYAVTIEESGDFYVIAEVQRGADGAQARTGNFYAANIYDGTLFKLQQDEAGRSVLIAIDANQDTPAGE